MFRGSLPAGNHTLRFGGVTHVMGVINVSPESKNPHTVAATADEALSLARRYREWGADVIDVGGQSSHIDNPTIAAEEEIARLQPVVEALVADGFIVSVDTWKPEVAEATVEKGAAIVNDTGGLRSPEMQRVVGSSGVAAVAVHVDGAHPHDVDEVVLDDDKAGMIADGFARLMRELEPDIVERLILDPGVAINYRGDYAAYTRLQLDVIRRTPDLAGLGRPLLVPIPRKRDIHWVTAYITLALEYGADMIRVHDVPIAVELTRLWGRRVADG
ncbi:MAG TPA: dihydropteroate synthase [Acidimicrobiia bacterium]|nr:dihydropteroate synthase [Acidimicrobiia bacterium]